MSIWSEVISIIDNKISLANDDVSCYAHRVKMTNIERRNLNEARINRAQLDMLRNDLVTCHTSQANRELLAENSMGHLRGNVECR